MLSWKRSMEKASLCRNNRNPQALRSQVSDPGKTGEGSILKVLSTALPQFQYSAGENNI